MSRDYAQLSVTTKDDKGPFLCHFFKVKALAYEACPFRGQLWDVSAWPKDHSVATVPSSVSSPTALTLQAVWKWRQEKGQNGIFKLRNKLQKYRRH